MDTMKIAGIGFICLAVFALVDLGCSQSGGTGEIAATGVEASAEAITENEIHLTLTRNGQVRKSKTIEISIPGPITNVEFRDGWAVAECHMNPSSSMFVAWNPETDKTCCSPGCTWLAAKDHFITIHKVHFNPPDDEKSNQIWYLDGKEIPLVTELPCGEDGHREPFLMLLSESPEGSVYRLSCYEKDMYDSSLLLLARPAGELKLLGVNRCDCGSRITCNYLWEVETEYSVRWDSGRPVIAVERVYLAGEVTSLDPEDGPPWKWAEERRTGILGREEIIWDGPAKTRSWLGDIYNAIDD